MNNETHLKFKRAVIQKFGSWNAFAKKIGISNRTSYTLASNAPYKRQYRILLKIANALDNQFEPEELV